VLIDSELVVEIRRHRSIMAKGRATVLAVVVLALTACGSDDGSSGPDRPDAAEKVRRAPLAAAALERTIDEPSRVGALTCIVDDDTDTIGYQLGVEDADADLRTYVLAGVIACAESEWDGELATSIAEAFQLEVEPVQKLVDRAVAAL
jgi:hypothetical protein